MTAMMTDSPQAAAAIRPMMYRSWLMSCKAITAFQHLLCQQEGQHAAQQALLPHSSKHDPLRTPSHHRHYDAH